MQVKKVLVSGVAECPVCQAMLKYSSYSRLLVKFFSQGMKDLVEENRMPSWEAVQGLGHEGRLPGQQMERLHRLFVTKPTLRGLPVEQRRGEHEVEACPLCDNGAEPTPLGVDNVGNTYDCEKCARVETVKLKDYIEKNFSNDLDHPLHTPEFQDTGFNLSHVCQQSLPTPPSLPPLPPPNPNQCPRLPHSS